MGNVYRLVIFVCPLCRDGYQVSLPNKNIQDRASGAIMRAFIGDALALGPHWYYSLAELHRDYGDWIDSYNDPKPGRYHNGFKAGLLSQEGFILKLMVRSLVDCGGTSKQIFVAGWMKSSFLFLMEHR